MLQGSQGSGLWGFFNVEAPRINSSAHPPGYLQAGPRGPSLVSACVRWRCAPLSERMVDSLPQTGRQPPEEAHGPGNGQKGQPVRAQRQCPPPICRASQGPRAALVPPERTPRDKHHLSELTSSPSERRSPITSLGAIETPCAFISCSQGRICRAARGQAAPSSGGESSPVSRSHCWAHLRPARRMPDLEATLEAEDRFLFCKPAHQCATECYLALMSSSDTCYYVDEP